MSQAFRLDDLMQVAREEGRIVAEDAAKCLGVTVQTIRRDLLTLADKAKLTRVHGGAVLPSGTTSIGDHDRPALYAGEKGGSPRAARRQSRTIPQSS